MLKFLKSNAVIMAIVFVFFMLYFSSNHSIIDLFYFVLMLFSVYKFNKEFDTL